MDVLSLSKLPRVAVITRLILVKTCILQGNFTQRLIRILLRFFSSPTPQQYLLCLYLKGLLYVQSLVSLLCQSISFFFSYLLPFWHRLTHKSSLNSQKLPNNSCMKKNFPFLDALRGNSIWTNYLRGGGRRRRTSFPPFCGLQEDRLALLKKKSCCSI